MRSELSSIARKARGDLAPRSSLRAMKTSALAIALSVVGLTSILSCSSDPPAGLACASRADCGEFEVCFDGRCVPPRCNDGGVCPGGRTCVSGACVHATDAATPPSTCTDDADCPEGRCVEGTCFQNECVEGQEQPCETRCGEGLARCRGGVFRCSARAESREVCGNGLDDDCNGQSDEGCTGCDEGEERACETECGPGAERCVDGAFRGCTAARVSPEICGNDLDEDCNGRPDDGCDGCLEGDARACETACGSGVESCMGEQWGGCTAALPRAELCNGEDDDCDGTVDDEITRDCSTSCGEGVETCAVGVWAGCTAMETCGCEGEVADQQVCGACGRRSRACEGGSFGAWSACGEGEGVCAPGVTEDLRCDRCGVQLRACTAECTWGQYQACIGQGSCEPGDLETEVCPGGCGERKRLCGEDCQPGEWGPCENGGVIGCAPGELEERPCGNCGKQRRVCALDCAFGEWQPCASEGECRPADEGAEACGVDGSRLRTCAETCAWGAFRPCNEAPQCSPEETESRACGQCGTQTRRCANGVWQDWAACDGQGPCRPGDEEAQACGTSDAGLCVLGRQSRTCDDDCRFGPFSGCAGNVEPVVEVCGDQLDQDCNGRIERRADEYEPNDECGDCTVVGGLDPNVFADATHDSETDGWDYYCFEVEDGVSIPFVGEEHIVVGLDNVPLNADLDLFLYESIDACRARQPLASSINARGLSEAIDWEERLNHADEGRFVVGVKRFSGFDCGRRYHLTFDGLR